MANSSVLSHHFKVLGICCLTLITILLQGCMYYSKPSYNGWLIDAEDGTPLAGVQVRVEYYVSHQTFVEQNTKTLFWFVTTTDINGYFEIPPYRTLKSPFSWNGFVVFSFRKKGYIEILPMKLADCLSIGCEEKVFQYPEDTSKVYIVSSHLIKLSRID